jgi:hypothetical protein
MTFRQEIFAKIWTYKTLTPVIKILLLIIIS